MELEEVDLIFPIGGLVGRYRVEALIGLGGMGQVYRAFHMDLEEYFALKAIKKDFVSSPSDIERFRREAKTANRLRHPNILSIDDFNLYGEICYLRMPYLKGIKIGEGMAVSLDQYVRLSGRPIELEKARQWLQEILSGVGHAHQNGVIHRDLKPSNILFEEGRAMVSDFGLVRIVGQDVLQNRIRLSVYRSQIIARNTNSGIPVSSSSSDSAMVGTYEFMAPEVKDGLEADEKSDIYAVGMIALFMLTGRSSLGIGMPSSNFKWIPVEWDEFFRLTLSTDPNDRFESATDVISWLERPKRKFKAKRSGEKDSASFINATSKSDKRSWRWLSVIFGMLAFLVLLFIFNRYMAIVDLERSWAEFKPRVELVVSSLTDLLKRDHSRQGTESNPVVLKGESGNDSSIGEADSTPENYPSEQGQWTKESYEPFNNLTQDSSIAPAQGLNELDSEGVISANTAGQNSSYTVVRPYSPPALQESGAGLPLEEVINASAVTSPVITESLSQLNSVSATRVKNEQLNLELAPGVRPMEFLSIKPGKFLFGSSSDEEGRVGNEPLKREVTIPKAFHMGRYEVTREQYTALVGRDPSRFRGDEMPANNISYDEMYTFIDLFNAKLRQADLDGLKARLPTAEEWEYAARAGEDGMYAGLPLEQLDERSLHTYINFGSQKPLKIGTLKPNRWGLHDMYGNIEECTEGGIIRGGSYKSRMNQVRSSSARPLGENFRENGQIGFRILIEESD